MTMKDPEPIKERIKVISEILDSSDGADFENYVKNALRELSSGKVKKVRELMEFIHCKRNDTESAIKIFSKMTESVSHFSGKSSPILVECLLSCGLVSGRNELFYQTFSEFIENLVSAHAFHTPAVLDRLVEYLRNFGPDTKQDVVAEKRSEFDNLIESDWGLIEDAIHILIRRILHIVPSITSTFIPTLANNFPHKTESIKTHAQYVRHLMLIAEYLPLLTDKILEFLIEKLIQIDVEVTIDRDELDEEEEQLFSSVELRDLSDDDSVQYNSDYSGFESDYEGESSGYEIEESDVDECEAVETQQELFERNKTMLAKVDIIVKLVFNFFKVQKSRDSGDLDSKSENKPIPIHLQSSFICMLSIFDRYILPTHRSKYSQILLFYLSLQHLSFAEAFISFLLSRIFDEASSNYIRINACSYLGSFIARSKPLPPKLISRSLKLCTEWIHSKLDKFGSRKQADQRTIVWISVIQTILYVFCFRWKELCYADFRNSVHDMPARKRLKTEKKQENNLSKDVVETEIEEFIGNRNSFDEAQLSLTGVHSPHMGWWRVRGGFERILFSKLNPLRHCSPEIVNEFDKISSEIQLTHCFSWIQAAEMEEESLANSPYAESPSSPSSTISSPLLGNSGNTVVNALRRQLNLRQVMETFFPFDPYHRHLSISDHIEPVYNNWAEDDEEVEDDNFINS